jgi:pilus assembly protein CpaC
MVTLFTRRDRAKKTICSLLALGGIALFGTGATLFGQSPALPMLQQTATSPLSPSAIQAVSTQATSAAGSQVAALPPSLGSAAPARVIHKIQAASERMELTANSSRIIKLDQKIPRVQVNNKDLLEITPLSPNEVQVFAKKPGVTQINLWDESNNIHVIDVLVFGDARELEEVLAVQFPNSKIKVRPIANSVILSGYVDSQEQVSGIIRIAEDYYPKVIPSITVGGVQQINLQVKVMEVSRTKLRTLGMDWTFSNGSDFITSGVSGLIGATTASTAAVSATGDTMRFGFVDGNNAFFGFLNALKRYELLKVMAEPNLVTVSGRPAFFNAGGEFPVIIPGSLGTVSIQYKKYGTQVDFVPIVLGNGNIRLEVKPRVSEIDPTKSVTISGTTVPGLRVREVDTGVEMKAGQTLALAGLVQTRVDAQQSGIPWLSDLPYLGVPFRKNTDTVNEVELLILVTPQFVNAVNADEVPPCGPGSGTTQPRDCDFYFRGHMEVPGCGPCAAGYDCDACQYQNMQQGTSGGVNLPGMPAQPTQPTPVEEIPRGATNGASYKPGSTTYSSNSMPVKPSQQISSNNTVRVTSEQRPTPAPATTSRPSGGTQGGFLGPLGYDVNQ